MDRCFFSADALRERLDECPRLCWRDVATAPFPILSASSLSAVSSEDTAKDCGEDESPRSQPVFSAQMFRANTFCFFQVSSRWDEEVQRESWEWDDVVRMCDLRSKSLRSLADSSRQSSLANEADLFMREGGVRPAWRMRASSSMARCQPVDSRKLLPSRPFRRRCPSGSGEVCSELGSLQGPGSVSIASLCAWGCPPSCASPSVVSRPTPSWRKACSSLSVCWILSSSWLPWASLLWASQPGPQPPWLPWELVSSLSSVSDSCTVAPSRVILCEQAWGRVWHCWLWLWSWLCPWEGHEVFRDGSTNGLVEASDDVSIWLSADVCTVTGIAPETWLWSEWGEQGGSGRLCVPEGSSLWSSCCDPVCFSESLDLADSAMISPWVSLCSVWWRAGGCSVLGEHRDSLTGGWSALGECSGDRWDTAMISSSCLSFCSSCSVARRTEPAGQSHCNTEGDCGREGGDDEAWSHSQDTASSWGSGGMSRGLWEDGVRGEEELEDGDGGAHDSGWQMASISVTIWRTDTPLSWWGWWGLALSSLSSDSWDTWESEREKNTDCINYMLL